MEKENNKTIPRVLTIFPTSTWASALFIRKYRRSPCVACYKISEALWLCCLARRNWCLPRCAVSLVFVTSLPLILHAEMADLAELKMRPPLYLGSVFSFIEGFLLAYQCSSGLWKFFQILFLFLMLPIARFWGWSESAWIQSRLWWAQPTCYRRQTLWQKLSVWVCAKHHIPQFAVFSVQILYVSCCH